MGAAQKEGSREFHVGMFAPVAAPAARHEADMQQFSVGEVAWCVLVLLKSPPCCPESPVREVAGREKNRRQQVDMGRERPEIRRAVEGEGEADEPHPKTQPDEVLPAMKRERHVAPANAVLRCRSRNASNSFRQAAVKKGRRIAECAAQTERRRWWSPRREQDAQAARPAPSPSRIVPKQGGAKSPATAVNVAAARL